MSEPMTESTEDVEVEAAGTEDVGEAEATAVAADAEDGE